MAHYDEFRGCEVIHAKQSAIAYAVLGHFRVRTPIIVQAYDNSGVYSPGGNFYPWQIIKKVRVYG